MLSLSTKFNFASLTETFYLLELPFCVTILTEKGKRFEPLTSPDNITTFVLIFFRDSSNDLFHWMQFI